MSSLEGFDFEKINRLSVNTEEVGMGLLEKENGTKDFFTLILGMSVVLRDKLNILLKNPTTLVRRWI